MHTIETKSKHYKIYVHHNSDWSGEVILNWDRKGLDKSSNGMLHVDGRDLLAGAVDGPVPMEVLLCATVAALNRWWERGLTSRIEDLADLRGIK